MKLIQTALCARRISIIFMLTVVIHLIALPLVPLTQVQSNAPFKAELVIRADQPKGKSNRNIYGHFAEHLGRCIYGGFYIGEGNKKIANTNGIRNDVVAALKKLKIPNLRWPGGCFADTAHACKHVGLSYTIGNKSIF